VARVRASDYDDKRRAILAAAAALFAEHGFGSTTISMLSERSGGSKAWIYHYYPSKEAILFDILDTHIRFLLDTVRSADGLATTPRDRLRALVLALLRAYERADDTHRVQMNDLGRLPADQQEHVKRLERQIVDVFADAISGAAPDLAERSLLAKPVTMSLLGMLNWHHNWWRPSGPLTLDAYADLVVSLVLDGLCATADNTRQSPRPAERVRHTRAASSR